MLTSLIFALWAAGSLEAASCSGRYSQADRDVILTAHNKLRSSIALGQYSVNASKSKFKPASNMQKMVWDCALENAAQSWADGCRGLVHSTAKDYGENLYMYWGFQAAKPSDYTQKACDSWSDEFQEFGLASTTMSWDVFNSGTGHATQMAWAQTSRLGCGIGLCGSGKTDALVVCRYQVKGNMMEQSIYKEGPACSACANSTTCEKKTGLCVSAA